MKKMAATEIENELIQLTRELLSAPNKPYQRDIKLEASLQRHLGIDSLGRAELFQRVEKKFAITVPDRLLAEAETLQDIANYLASEHPAVHTPVTKKIITSHGEKASVNPMQAETLIDLLRLYAEKSPQKTHIYFQHEDGSEEAITYEQLWQSALTVANRLRQMGLKEGETVAIMLPTTPGFFYSFFGVLLAGGIPVPIYPPFRMHMLEAYAKLESRILNSAQVRILITFEKAEKLSRLMQAFVPSLQFVTTVDTLLQEKPLERFHQAKAEHFAFIQYTSGSTADPKGVLLTHANLIANVRAYGKAIQVTPDDVAVSWLPLYHDMGLIGMWLGSLFYGIPLIVMTPFSFLNHPERWLWAIHYHRGTLSGAPNFAYELCIRKIEPEQIEGLDLSSWRMAANGAEKVYPKTLEQFAKKFAPYGFNRQALLPVYGLAESTVGLAIPPLHRDFRIDYVEREKFETERLAIKTDDKKNALPFVACGMPIEGHEIRIVDDAHQPLPERHVGNLEFRGPSNMQGYFNNPRATAAVYHEGWINSGDLAYLADGEVFITGRRKDLIIKAGRNLYPAELEELVGVIPGVRQGCVAAFGINAADRGTEQLIIVAETREKNKTVRAALIDKIKEAVATTLDIVPDEIVLVAPRIVPKTSSGKLQRALCKKMYLEHRLGHSQSPAWVQASKLGINWCIQKIKQGIGRFFKLCYTIYSGCVLLISLPFLYLAICFASQKTAAILIHYYAKCLAYVLFCPIKVVGREHIGHAQPVIFAANHASYVDAIISLATLPIGTRFVAKKELFKAPILKTFIKKLNYLSVDRSDLPKGVEDTKQIEMALQAGHSVLIFPEGTFGYASGLRPFRSGAFKIAAQTNIPICPIALRGTRFILRDDEKLMRPNRVIVTICEPIKAIGTEWQDVMHLRNKVREKIAQYCGEPSLDYIAAQTVAPKPQKNFS